MSSRPSGVLVEENASAGRGVAEVVDDVQVAPAIQWPRVTARLPALSKLKLVLSGPPQRSELAAPGSAALASVVAGGASGSRWCRRDRSRAARCC